MDIMNGRDGQQEEDVVYWGATAPCDDYRGGHWVDPQDAPDAWRDVRDERDDYMEEIHSECYDSDGVVEHWRDQREAARTTKPLRYG